MEDYGMAAPGRIRFMTLPLFLNGWLVRYARPRFRLWGKKVVSRALLLGARPLAQEMGAVIGRARPQLVDRTIRSQFKPGANTERIKERMRQLVAERLSRGPVETFGDFFEQGALMDAAHNWLDADNALGDLSIYSMQGLVFGSEYPELTVRLVERHLAWAGSEEFSLIKEAGLRLPPQPDSQTYGDWERYLLRLVDTWEARWGSLAP
jgi:hypothetical protein